MCPKLISVTWESIYIFVCMYIDVYTLAPSRANIFNK